MKLLFCGFRDQRHSKYGGYDWIRFYPESDYYSDKDVLLGNIPVGKSGKFINLKILDFMARKKAKNYDIIHYFYGDLGIFRPLPKNRKYKAIATIHCNTDQIEAHHKNIIKCIKSFDAIVVLNSQQCKYLSEKYKINTFFVPHGFNSPKYNNIQVTNFIKDFDNSKINIITIGKQYRDYFTLEKVIQEQNNTKIHFYLVGLHKDYKEKFSKYPNVTVCGFLNDDQYYSLINSCDWSFLPLNYATANNALMESHYLGVPCILPNIPGVTDYADPDNNLFYDKNHDIVSIFNNLKKQEKIENLRLYALNHFSWEIVYNKLNKIYTKLLGEGNNV